jgi:hypothetical protein
VFWPIKAILRWRYDQTFPLMGRAAALYRGTRIVALFDLLFFVALTGFFSYALSDHLEFMNAKNDWILRLIQVLGLIGTIGVFVPVLNAVQAFNGGHRPWTKITDVLVAAACVLSAWYAISAHALTVSLNY